MAPTARQAGRPLPNDVLSTRSSTTPMHPSAHPPAHPPPNLGASTSITPIPPTRPHHRNRGTVPRRRLSKERTPPRGGSAFASLDRRHPSVSAPRTPRAARPSAVRSSWRSGLPRPYHQTVSPPPSPPPPPPSPHPSPPAPTPPSEHAPASAPVPLSRNGGQWPPHVQPLLPRTRQSGGQASRTLPNYRSSADRSCVSSTTRKTTYLGLECNVAPRDASLPGSSISGFSNSAPSFDIALRASSSHSRTNHGTSPSHLHTRAPTEESRPLLLPAPRFAPAQPVELNTQSRDAPSVSHLALDCEMVGVGPAKKSALARVSLVDRHGQVVYDTFVQPPGGKQVVTDYRTWVSGVNPSDLDTAPVFDQVQAHVACLIKGKVLIGHALYNDFAALQLSHPVTLTRDTACNKWISLLAHAEALKGFVPPPIIGRNAVESVASAVTDFVPAVGQGFLPPAPYPPFGTGDPLTPASLKQWLDQLQTLLPTTYQAVQVPSLKRVAKLILGRQVQNSGSHSSIDDARTTMQIFCATTGLWEQDGPSKDDTLTGSWGASWFYPTSSDIPPASTSVRPSRDLASGPSPAGVQPSPFSRSTSSSPSVPAPASTQSGSSPGHLPVTSRRLKGRSYLDPEMGHWLQNQTNVYRMLMAQLDRNVPNVPADTRKARRKGHTQAEGIRRDWLRVHASLRRIRALIEPLDPQFVSPMSLPAPSSSPSVRSYDGAPHPPPKSAARYDLYARVAREWNVVAACLPVLEIPAVTPQMLSATPHPGAEVPFCPAPSPDGVDFADSLFPLPNLPPFGPVGPNTVSGFSPSWTYGGPGWGNPYPSRPGPPTPSPRRQRVDSSAQTPRRPQTPRERSGTSPSDVDLGKTKRKSVASSRMKVGLELEAISADWWVPDSSDGHSEVRLTGFEEHVSTSAAESLLPAGALTSTTSRASSTAHESSAPSPLKSDQNGEPVQSQLEPSLDSILEPTSERTDDPINHTSTHRRPQTDDEPLIQVDSDVTPNAKYPRAGLRHSSDPWFASPPWPAPAPLLIDMPRHPVPRQGPLSSSSTPLDSDPRPTRGQRRHTYSGQVSAPSDTGDWSTLSLSRARHSEPGVILRQQTLLSLPYDPAQGLPFVRSRPAHLASPIQPLLTPGLVVERSGVPNVSLASVRGEPAPLV